MFTQMVNTVGFPIAISFALFYQNHKNNEMYNKTFSEFKDVINQNSTSIQKLTEIVNDIKIKTNTKGGE